jgi:hypothetical protein
MENSKSFKEHIIAALVHFLYNFFVYFIFLTPFNLWVKATKRLSHQKEAGGLEISKITGLWPFLSFLKRFILDFLIDGIIFLSYILAPLIFIFLLINDASFGEAFLIGIISIYFFPFPMSILRDGIQLGILPFKKFLSWASKPAQYMDLEIKNK